MKPASQSELSDALQIAMQHRIAGRLEEAKAAYEEILRRAPNHATALHMLGIIAHQTGNAALALTLVQRARDHSPNDATIHNDLGGLLNLRGNLDGAVESYQRSLALNPANAQAHYNLGCTFQAQGQLAAAESSYREALKITPDAADILCNLGGCLQEQGKVDDAIACYRQALALNPNDINALNNLGVSLQTNDKLDEARACFERTIVLQPNFARAYINLGMVDYDYGNFARAMTRYQQALKIDPAYSEAQFSIGVTLQALCRPKEALECYRLALTLKSDNPKSHNNLLMTLQFVPGISQEDLRVAHTRFGEHFEKALKPHWPQHANVRDPNKRLRIGYVSGDFRKHAVAYFIEPVFANHDKSQIEIFCYSNSSRHDAFTDRLIAESDHWQSCVSMSDDQLAQRIHADGIDILVDLAGHTAQNRLLTFARKPAPMQITYLGYPGSSGLTAMDYRLTDSYTEPGSDRYYTEKLLRLPDSMWCYRPSADMPEPTPLPALANGYVTFGSFNSVTKVSDDCLQLWAALLGALPTSRLVMATAPEGEVRERLMLQFQTLGVAPARISFQPKLPQHEFQRALQRVDISLDPFPINGATTTCESLWLGVPVLTLVGERFLSRAGLSVLSAAQLPDFVAKTQEELIGTATLLANNLPLLANIRAGLRDHLKVTPLLDQHGFTRNLERLYRDVWTRYCNSRGY